MIADCRKCKHFVSLEEIDDRIPVKVAEDLAFRKHVLGVDIKGYCLARKKPVTYYCGRCRYYEPRHGRRKQLTLTGKVAWVE